MSKPVKELIVKELATRYGEANSAVWVEFLGVDGLSNTELRRGLHARQMRLEVVKNALLRRAVATAPLGRLAERLQGPAALVTGGESAIEIAKALEEWTPKLKGLKLRGALLDGELIDETQVEGLARMPSKRDLQGRVVGSALSPGAKLVSAILAPGSAIAGCLKALIEKLEKGGDAAPAEAPAAS